MMVGAELWEGATEENLMAKEQALKIVILMRVPHGTTAEVVATGTTDLPDQAAAARALRPDPPMPRHPTAAQAALGALTKVGVDHPERTLRRYSARRIIEVCTHCMELARQGKLKNPPAWTVTALRRGWTVPPHKETES
jgi:hypothetical protein